MQDSDHPAPDATVTPVTLDFVEARVLGCLIEKEAEVAALKIELARLRASLGETN